MARAKHFTKSPAKTAANKKKAKKRVATVYAAVDISAMAEHEVIRMAKEAIKRAYHK